MAEDYAEALFTSIDTIINERMRNLPYDQTIIARIIDNSHALLGQYTVIINNATPLTVYSNNCDYNIDDLVYVCIPKGDYNEQKIIIGKYIPEINANAATASNAVFYVDATPGGINTKTTIDNSISGYSGVQIKNSSSEPKTATINNTEYKIDPEKVINVELALTHSNSIVPVDGLDFTFGYLIDDTQSNYQFILYNTTTISTYAPDALVEKDEQLFSLQYKLINLSNSTLTAVEQDLVEQDLGKHDTVYYGIDDGVARYPYQQVLDGTYQLVDKALFNNFPFNAAKQIIHPYIVYRSSVKLASGLMLYSNNCIFYANEGISNKYLYLTSSTPNPLIITDYNIMGQYMPDKQYNLILQRVDIMNAEPEFKWNDDNVGVKVIYNENASSGPCLFNIDNIDISRNDDDCTIKLQIDPTALLPASVITNVLSITVTSASGREYTYEQLCIFGFMRSSINESILLSTLNDLSNKYNNLLTQINTIKKNVNILADNAGISISWPDIE